MKVLKFICALSVVALGMGSICIFGVFSSILAESIGVNSFIVSMVLIIPVWMIFDVLNGWDDNG